MNTLLAVTVPRLEVRETKRLAEEWAKRRNMPITVVVTNRGLRSQVTITTPFWIDDAIRNDLRNHIAFARLEMTAW